MTRGGWVLSTCLGLLAASAAHADDSRRGAPRARPDAPILPLHTSSTSPISQGGYLAWAGPAVCDQDGNVFFLVVPDSAQLDTGAGQSQFNPRDVLRITANGKERVTFSPKAAPKFADAKDLATHAIALDREGTLFMLVSASWEEKTGEKTGQYIISFDRKGKFLFELETDSQAIVAHQFEVFGSGGFLLRGRRTDTDEARLMVLSAGGVLRDVVDHPAKLLAEPSPSSAPRFDFMARGYDGRVYLTEQGGGKERSPVHVVDALGESSEAFKLVPTPDNRRLFGWHAAADRLAATYMEQGRSSSAASGAERGRWWIAVYGNLTGRPELQTVYGPAPGPPVCYQYEGSEDKFTFLKDGTTFVSMVP